MAKKRGRDGRRKGVSRPIRERDDYFDEWAAMPLQISPSPPTKNALLSTKTKVRFLNDVCLRQMMWAVPMMTLTLMMCACGHIGANIASLRPMGATSYLRSKCIISPQAMHHLRYTRLTLLYTPFYCSFAKKVLDFSRAFFIFITLKSLTIPYGHKNHDFYT